MGYPFKYNESDANLFSDYFSQANSLYTGTIIPKS